MDLHDGLIQQLYGIGLRLGERHRRVETRPGAGSCQDIDGAVEGLNSVIREVRSHIFHLQPNQLEGAAYGGALELLEDLSVNALIRTDLECRR